MATRFLAACTILLASFAQIIAKDQSPVGAGIPPLTQEMAKRIELALEGRIECDFTDSPLDEVVHHLEKAHRIPIWIDKQALQDEGVALDQQLTLVKSDITLQTAFSLMLEPLGLTTVNEEGVLKVTTRAKADEKMSIRIYPVADLVNAPLEPESYKIFIVMIQNQTSGRWVDIDQEGGAITAFPNAQSLVIRQSQKVQRETEGILAALRKAKRLQRVSSIPVNGGDPESLYPIEPSQK
ncbi:MAG: hypothetical protein JWP89_5528 [Schlesneria sp.]|nr:hypothetical protein [Schlesneria sp.]